MKYVLFIIFGLVCVLTTTVSAQQPQATLRLAPGCYDQGGVEKIPKDANPPNCYMVEIYMPESLDRNAYGAPIGDKICKDDQGNVVNCPAPNFATLFNKKALTAFPVTISPNDASLENGRKNRIFAIYLPKDFPVNKPLQLIFDPYNSVNGQLKFPSITVAKDFTVSFAFDNYNQSIIQKVEYNEFPIKCDDVDEMEKAVKDAEKEFQGTASPENQTAIDEAKASLKVAKGCRDDMYSLRNKYNEYRDNRLSGVRIWIENQDLKSYQIRVEDLNKCLSKEVQGEVKKGCITFGEWAAFEKTLPTPDTSGMNMDQTTKVYHKFLNDRGRNLPPLSNPVTNGEFTKIENLIANFEADETAIFLKKRNLTIDDLEQFLVKKVETYPIINPQVYQDRRILAEYQTKNGLPTKFNMQLTYKEIAPFEIAQVFKVTSQEMTEVTINTREDTGAAGERTRPNRLDAAFQFGSSVDEKENEVNGVKVKNIERTTRGTLDLRASAFRPVEPTNWFAWEPLFIDAKISNDKITKDSLSLNRVVIGTSFDFTKFLKTKNALNPTYFNFNLKPVQASDRDFKQLEYKVIGEFQPRLSLFNRIPANFRSTVNRVISKEGDLPTRFVAPAWGYKLQPVFGGEIGKTWLRRNPAEAIEQTNYIQRLYTGIDMTFYMPFNASLSIFNKFYWNFGKDLKGKEVDGQENMFRASLDIGLRKKNELGDSIYFSFEKGNEPPFGARDKNIFKIGYRFVNPKFFKPW